MTFYLASNSSSTILEQPDTREVRSEKAAPRLTHQISRLHALMPTRLFGQDRDHEAWYRRALRDRPWQACDCPICQDVGIEVIIFRKNNRNRRRGFHNAKVFYDHFREAVMVATQRMEDGEAMDEQMTPRQLHLNLFDDDSVTDA